MLNGYRGIFPALLTPFDRKDRVNEQVLADLVEFNLKKGVHGFYADGSTAEAFLLTFEERKQILKVVAEAAKGRCKLIAQIGCVATKQAIELAEYGAALGYRLRPRPRTFPPSERRGEEDPAGRSAAASVNQLRAREV